VAQSPLSVTKFIKAFIAWWLIWALMEAAVLYWFGLSWRIAFADSAIFNICTSSSCLFLSYVMQFYLPQQERYWYILFISIILSAASVFLSRWLLTQIFSQDSSYLILLKNSFPIRWAVDFLLIVCMSMICVVWYTFGEQQDIERRKNDAETLTKEAELLALRRQLQPHFLFNSLNSISALAGSRPQEARSMIQQLSDFLRGTIKKDDNQMVSLTEELKHLKLYLAIEQVRFGHRLRVNIATTEESGAMQLPSLILQPIVENAIKFGLYDTIESVTISINAVKENEQLIITVQNPYDAETAKPQKGAGFGLSSVQRRLYLLFARNDLVITKAENKLFTTTIKIPQLL
jgi:hypothetical protein